MFFNNDFDWKPMQSQSTAIYAEPVLFLLSLDEKLFFNSLAFTKAA